MKATLSKAIWSHVNDGLLFGPQATAVATQVNANPLA
ncbi:hypothetical protein CTA2_4400 [Colletotrichum tanaceti]|nr:hypothetical protein CTA2_4400 [Colletotrichum tanaceti]